MRLKCPHCAALAITRTSREMSNLTRELYYQCSNLSCAHTFVAQVEVTRSISPSYCPNPSVVLPMAPRHSIPFELLLTLYPKKRPDDRQLDLLAPPEPVVVPLS